MPMTGKWNYLHFGKISVGWAELTISLKRNFNTAHSCSSSRNNFFVQVESPESHLKGFGECGLPPKKPHCYLADCQDCLNFMEILSSTLSTVPQMESIEDLTKIHHNLFKQLPEEYFSICNPAIFTKSTYKQVLADLLVLLETAKKLCGPSSRAVSSALEFAILDLWSKLQHKSLSQLIFPHHQHHQSECSSFYTLSYEDNKDMIANALQSLKYTPFIKIKFIDDIPRLMELMVDLETASNGHIQKYIVDANASWSLNSFKCFMDIITQERYENILKKVLYIQQPFPIEMNELEQEEWKKIKLISPVKIMMDQSFSGCEQIQKALNLAHAVNIKSEKAGGPINCVKAVHLTQQVNLEIMLGSMVCTQLGCAQTYCLHPASRWLDVDGSLLVASPSMEGGFKWGENGFLVSPDTKNYGIQVQSQIFDDQT